MDFLTKEEDGTVIIREFVGQIEMSKESVHAFTEAKKLGKKGKLVVTIAGIHEGITRNLTEYLKTELEKSIPTWTSPYNTPVLINHDQADVDKTIGRIINAQMGDHNGVKALMFTAELTDPVAIEKVKDGRYYTVSIGSRAGGVVCSICGNDWAKDYCEHERGHYYLTDESDPKSAKQCTWQIVGMEGLELSYVAVPSDKNAMNIAASHQINDDVDKSEALEDLCAKLYMFSESGAIDLIKKDGTMEHVGEEEVAAELVAEDETEEIPAETEETEEEVVTDEEDETAPAEESESETNDEESETDETVAEEEAEEDATSEDEAEETVEEVEDEASEDEDAESEDTDEEPESEEVAEESAEVTALTEEITSLRAALKQTTLELLMALKGIFNAESDEAKDIVSRYEEVDEQVLVDLVKGERANKIAIGLAEVKNSVGNPTLTEDPVETPHNPAEKKSSVKVKVKGSNKTLSITPKEDRIKSVKVRR